MQLRFQFRVKQTVAILDQVNPWVLGATLFDIFHQRFHRTDNPGWITPDHHPGRNVSQYNSAGGHHRIRTNRYARHDDGTVADKGIGTDIDAADRVELRSVTRVDDMDDAIVAEYCAVG